MKFKKNSIKLLDFSKFFPYGGKILLRGRRGLSAILIVFIQGKRRHLLCLLATNYSRKEAAPPPAPQICAYLRLCGKVKPPRAILLRKQRRRGKPNTKPIATVGFSLNSRNYHTAALAKKISKKDFLRRGAASVLSVVFGCAEPPAGGAPPRRRQFKKKFVTFFS